MKTTRTLLLATVAALTLLAPLAQAAAPQLVVLSGGKLWLEAPTTIPESKSDAPTLAFTMHDDATKWAADKTGPDAVESLVLANGVTGMDVKDLMEAGKYREIAEYCLRDVKATVDLYKIWKERLAGIK